MPAAIPAIIPGLKAAAPWIVSGVGALLGKSKKSDSAKAAEKYKPNAAYTGPMAQTAGSLLPMAQKGYQQAFDYHSGVMANPELATASDAASLGRQTQQLTDRASRTMPRGGASAMLVGQLPSQQMAAGLERRIGAQQQSAANLGQLASSAGGLGGNIFSNLLGNELGGAQIGVQQGYLDLQRSQQDRGLGGSIFDILTGKNPTDPNSPLGKLGGWLGTLGKGGKLGGNTPGGNVPISQLPNYSDWDKILGGMGR